MQQILFQGVAGGADNAEIRLYKLFLKNQKKH